MSNQSLRQSKVSGNPDGGGGKLSKKAFLLDFDCELVRYTWERALKPKDKDDQFVLMDCQKAFYTRLFKLCPETKTKFKTLKSQAVMFSGLVSHICSVDKLCIPAALLTSSDSLNPSLDSLYIDDTTESELGDKSSFPTSRRRSSMYVSTSASSRSDKQLLSAAAMSRSRRAHVKSMNMASDDDIIDARRFNSFKGGEISASTESLPSETNNNEGGNPPISHVNNSHNQFGFNDKKFPHSRMNNTWDCGVGSGGKLVKSQTGTTQKPHKNNNNYENMDISTSSVETMSGNDSSYTTSSAISNSIEKKTHEISFGGYNNNNNRNKKFNRQTSLPLLDTTIQSTHATHNHSIQHNPNGHYLEYVVFDIDMMHKIKDLGKTYAKMGITVDMFDVVLQCLLGVLERRLPNLSKVETNAWRRVFVLYKDIMMNKKSSYVKAVSKTSNATIKSTKMFIKNVIR